MSDILMNLDRKFSRETTAREWMDGCLTSHLMERCSQKMEVISLDMQKYVGQWKFFDLLLNLLP